MNSGGSFFAFGSPMQVGAASLGYGIGSLIRRSIIADQCMTMHGYKAQ
jgi:hypothetical protein